MYSIRARHSSRGTRVPCRRARLPRFVLISHCHGCSLTKQTHRADGRYIEGKTISTGSLAKLLEISNLRHRQLRVRAKTRMYGKRREGSNGRTVRATCRMKVRHVWVRANECDDQFASYSYRIKNISNAIARKYAMKIARDGDLGLNAGVRGHMGRTALLGLTSHSNPAIWGY